MNLVCCASTSKKGYWVYISKINLKSVRCFDDETIELGDSHSSLLIAGNNAAGKSSILRSIAMGLCDEASAGGLLRELLGNFIRTDKEDAAIKIEFAKQDGNKWAIETKLKLHEKSNFERVVQTYFKNGKEIEDWKAFPWENIFIVGYGAGLRTDGTEDYDQYFPGDAVYTLFKYSQTLQNPELAWRRLQSIKGVEKKVIDENIASILDKVLDLDKGNKVVLEPNGIFVKKDKHKVELGAVGDGYRAMTTLILDLLSWQFLMQNDSHRNGGNWKELDLNEIKGVVIIDEIEKHLHPLLQRRIIKHLSENFKKVQFIVSTHSPLCVSGVSDVATKNWKIITSHVVDEHHKITEKAIPSGLRADQILVEYFDLETTVSIEAEELISKYQDLSAKKNRSEEDGIQLKELEAQLEKYDYNLAENVRDREMQKRLLKILEKEMSND